MRHGKPIELRVGSIYSSASTFFDALIFYLIKNPLIREYSHPHHRFLLKT